MIPAIKSTNDTSATSSRRLSGYVIVIATAVFVLIPLAINPGAAILYTAEAF